MRFAIRENYKIILSAIQDTFFGFLFAYILANGFEDYYRQLIRYLFRFFNGDSIRFIGKNFHLFPSLSFIINFGIFTSLAMMLFRFSFKPHRIRRISLMVLIFFSTTILTIALDSKRLIIECTTCQDGIRRLTFDQLAFDNYFSIGLFTAIAYLLTTFLLERKRLRKTNEPI